MIRNRISRIGHLSPQAVWVIATVAITIAVTGYFVGLRESRKSMLTPQLIPAIPPEKTKGDDPFFPAPKYLEIPQKKRGPNRLWKASLSQLEQPAEVPPPKSPSSEKERELALKTRESHRAFEGAPPMIPHAIMEQGTVACMACHEKGLIVGKKVASKMSHPFYANCTQCHVSVVQGSLTESIPSVRKSERAFPGAPPATPHPVWMHEQCLSCHGPSGLVGLRTTHPERGSCLQCHSTSAPLDRVPLAIQPTGEKK